MHKWRFLKISFPCTFPVFTLSKTKDEPRTNQGRTKEGPINSEIQMTKPEKG